MIPTQLEFDVTRSIEQDQARAGVMVSMYIAMLGPYRTFAWDSLDPLVIDILL